MSNPEGNTSRQEQLEHFLTPNLVAGTELLDIETSQPVSVITGLSASDTVFLDCGFINYSLTPTVLPKRSASEPPAFRVRETYSSRKDLSPRIPTGIIIVVDGTASGPTGAMMRPGELIRNGYLAVRVPAYVKAEDKVAHKKSGGRLSKDNILLGPDGALIFNPFSLATELMNHMAIQKSNGTKLRVF